MQRLSAITHARFGLFRFRSPLLTESRLFSLPVGTEMFHFPTFPPTTLCVQVEVAGHYSGFFRGFPIRRSPDRSSFTSSPGLIAGYNVLHRLLVPRHPPIALSSLLFLQRCSRPLCSSQETGGPRNLKPCRLLVCWSAEELRLYSRPFRTQQRAQAHSVAPMFHSPRGCTDDGLNRAGLIVNVPLSCLLTPRTFALEGERWTEVINPLPWAP